MRSGNTELTGGGSLLPRLCGAVAAVCWLLALAAGVVRGFAGSPAVLETVMRRTAPAEQTGLPDAEYAGVARMTAGYLTGKEAEFQYRIREAGGEEILCFQPHEAAHMADCRELIRLDTRVFWAALAAGVIAFAVGALLERRNGRDGRAVRRGMRAGMWIAGGIVSVLLAWAAVNFEGFFVTFHRLAFTNEGWLLNPRTDLLIRLMPTEFFIFLGIAGGIVFLAGAAVMAVCLWKFNQSERGI